MRERLRDATPEDFALEEKLQGLLGGERRRYLIIHREESTDDPRKALFRAYAGGLEDEGTMLSLILNFLDGYLEDEEFVIFAHMASRRALERQGVLGDDLDRMITKFFSQVGEEGSRRDN